MSNGVVYVSTQPDFDRLAAVSILTLRRFYKGPIMVLTDAERPTLDKLKKHCKIETQVVEIAEGQEASRFMKSRCGLYTPWDRCAFIDADTFVCRPIDKLWRFVDKERFAMSMDRTHKTIGDGAARARHAAKPWFAAELKHTVEVLGAESPHYNSGVMVWRKCTEITQLFEAYYAEWLRFQRGDQFALMRALKQQGMALHVLPDPYNHIRQFDAKRTVICHPTRRKMQLYRHVKQVIKASGKVLDQRAWEIMKPIDHWGLG